MLAALLVSSTVVGTPVELDGVVVTPRQMQPARTLGGHKARAVFTVVNTLADVVDVEVECSFYLDDDAVAVGRATVRAIQPGSEAIGEALSREPATGANCRPVNVIAD